MMHSKKQREKIIISLKKNEIKKVFTQILGKDIISHSEQLGVDFESIFKFSPIAENCKEKREEKGLSIKEVAEKLKVPQYRIKAIEGTRLKGILPDILIKYCDFLGLEIWLREWLNENKKLSKKLGIKT